MTDDDLLHRFSAFGNLTPKEQAGMRDLIGHPSSFKAMQTVRSEGSASASLFFLHEGWVLSSVIHVEGRRQGLKLHRRGDLMGAPSLPFETAVESLVALTPAKVSTIPLSRLGALFAAHPRLGTVLLLTIQEQHATLVDRLAVSGQLSAKHGVAALLLLLFDERPPSDRPGYTLHVPLSQVQIGEMLGLSAVHINRVVAILEAEGLIKRSGLKGNIYELTDVPKLREIVGLPERVRRRDRAWLPPSKL